MVSSKQPKLGLTQEFFARISESTTGYTFSPCVGSFTSPGIDTRQKGPPAFSVSSERHRQMLREKNCLSFETAVGGSLSFKVSVTLHQKTLAVICIVSSEGNIQHIMAFTCGVDRGFIVTCHCGGVSSTGVTVIV